MFAGGYDRIYHYHLKKCGGTSLNAWLNRQTSDVRYWNRIGAAEHDPGKTRGAAIASRYWADVIHSHAPVHDLLPAKTTFTFTVLRDPVRRLLSQVGDYRRESMVPDATHVLADPELFSDAATLPLSDFLEKYAADGRQRWFFDNCMTRALAATNPTDFKSSAVAPIETVHAAARRNLRSRYDFVGLTEHMVEVRLGLGSRLGLAPDVVGGERRNVSRSEDIAPEVVAARDVIERLTRFDRILYQDAERLFRRHYEGMARRFNETAFENKHAAEAVQQLRPVRMDGRVAFSVRDRIIGHGFHGRDGEGAENCRVWTGPEDRCVLYLPVPSGEHLEVCLWIHGYGEEAVRSSLQIELDDEPAAFRLEQASGWRDLLVAVGRSKRSFLKLAITAPGAASTLDQRRRGVSFDRYGWRVVDGQSYQFPNAGHARDAD